MARRIALAAALLVSLLLPTAHATSFSVINNADSGTGSLRAAIIAANADPLTAHSITFTASYTIGAEIILGSPLPLIEAQTLTISGSNRSPIVNGGNAHQILRVSGDNLELEVNNMELRNGRSTQYGGCIEDASGGGPTAVGTLRLVRVVFAGCSASTTSLVNGGAVYWVRGQGNLRINFSRFSANYVRATIPTGQSAGGAVYANSDVAVNNTLFENNGSTTDSNGGMGGALALKGSQRSFSVQDSTFQGNAASPGAIAGTFGYGGAINQNCDDCTLEVQRSYFKDNAAIFGGAIYASRFSAPITTVALRLKNNSFVANWAADSGGATYITKASLELSNNTFYNNEALSGSHLTFGYSGNSLTYAKGNLLAPTANGMACSGTTTRPNPSLITANLFSDASCGQISATSLPNSPLGSITIDETPGQIGVVQFTGSAVIDSISNNGDCDVRDARYQQRPIDGNGDGIARCDVGAYEHPNLFVFRDGFED